MLNIGFVGLGNMGKGMAINLSKNNYNIIGFDIDEKVFDNYKNFNITKAISLEELSKGCDIVITMLPNGSIVRTVWNTIIENCKKGTLIVDCSTIDVISAKEIQQKCIDKDIMSLDAPVSGGVIGANNGSLTFMVGGDKKNFDKMLPLFNIMGNKAVLCGVGGSGQATKICNNMLLAITMIGVGEAFKLGQNLELDPNKLFDVISTATGSCWAVNNYCPIKEVGPKSPADENFKPGFAGKLMLKDLSLALEAINNTASKAPFGILAHNQFNQMVLNNNGDLDFSAIINENN